MEQLATNKGFFREKGVWKLGLHWQFSSGRSLRNIALRRFLNRLGNRSARPKISIYINSKVAKYALLALRSGMAQGEGKAAFLQGVLHAKTLQFGP
ncbi:hypothetical protein CH365_14160 [Leptospira neocaledonica]|uniref:Uncharacterized protein n=1 Tax=Leptospira neocaledonica TaxID=2023192 RepID=A0A2M9ZWT1_9LEPT|nr:hypothetical protein CH365_14160 [Leptospira neocaledonica]